MCVPYWGRGVCLEGCVRVDLPPPGTESHLHLFCQWGHSSNGKLHHWHWWRKNAQNLSFLGPSANTQHPIFCSPIMALHSRPMWRSLIALTTCPFIPIYSVVSTVMALKSLRRFRYRNLATGTTSQCSGLPIFACSCSMSIRNRENLTVGQETTVEPTFFCLTCSAIRGDI